MRDAKDFGSVTHAVRRVIFVVKLVGREVVGRFLRNGDFSLSMNRAPGAGGCAGGRDELTDITAHVDFAGLA